MIVNKVPHAWWHVFFTKWVGTRHVPATDSPSYTTYDIHELACSKCKTVYEIPDQHADYKRVNVEKLVRSLKETVETQAAEIAGFQDHLLSASHRKATVHTTIRTLKFYADGCPEEHPSYPGKMSKTLLVRLRTRAREAAEELEKAFGIQS